MNLIGPAGDGPDGPHGSVDHQSVAGLETQAAKVGGEAVPRMHHAISLAHSSAAA